MSLQRNRSEPLLRLCGYLESILTEQPASLHPSEFTDLGPQGAAIIKGIQRLAQIQPRFMGNGDVSPSHSPATGRRTHEDVELASQLAAGAREAVPDAGGPYYTELSLFLHRLFTFLHMTEPSGATTRSSLSFGWRDDVNETFEEDRQITGALLEEHKEYSNACWSALELAYSLDLRNWSELLANHVLSASRPAVLLATRLRNTPLAAALRGRYMAAWHIIRRAAAGKPGEFRASGPAFLWFDIGRELRRMHARPASPGSFPGSRSLSTPAPNRSELSPPIPSAAAREFDIALLFRGQTAEEWEDFVRGYTGSKGDDDPITPPGIDRSRLADELRPVEFFGIERPGTDPDDQIRLCTYALRTDRDLGDKLLERLQAARGTARLEERARDAAVLAAESKDVRPDVMQHALDIFSSSVRELYNAERPDAVDDVVRRGMLYVAGLLDDSARAWFEGLRNLSLAHLAGSPEESIDLVLQGCRRLGATDAPAALTLAYGYLASLLEHPLAPDRLGDILRTLISTVSRSALLENHGDPIRRVINLLQELGDTAKLGSEEVLLVEAFDMVAAELLASPEERTPGSVDAALAVSVAYPELVDLDALLLGVRPSDDLAEALPEDVSAPTRLALLEEDWRLLAESSRRDLVACAQRDVPESRRLLVGYLALALRRLGEAGSADAMNLAHEVLDLVGEHADEMLRAAPAPSDDEVPRWADSASNLALSAVRMYALLPRGTRQFPMQTIALLEKAVELAETRSSIERAACLHDLAHAYRQYAKELPPDDAFACLERAASLFRETLVIYRQLRRDPAYRVKMRDRPIHIDYLNLGDVYLSLAQLAPSFDLPTVGPHASPLYLRAGLCVLAIARDVAIDTGRLAEAAYANLSLANVGVQLALVCLEHTRSTGGALRRQFHDWLCVIEGPVFTTWDFATRYGSFALGQVQDVIALAVYLRDESLLHRALRALFDVWRIAELRHGVSGGPILFDDNWWNMYDLRINSLLTAEAMLNRLTLQDPGLSPDPLFDEIREYAHYFAGRIHLALFEAFGRHAEHLIAAADHFEWLRLHGNPISRALSRPYADWLRVSGTADRMLVNDLLLAAGATGLEVTLLAQRQSFVIEGLRVVRLAADLRESSWIKRNSVSALVGTAPQIDWSGVPPVVPVVAGLCESSSGLVEILAVQIPTTSWDAWVIHLGQDAGGFLELAFPLTAQNAGGPETTTPDGATFMAGEVAILAAEALVLELCARPRSGEENATLELNHGPGQTRVRSRASEITVALRTTPAIVNADTAVLAKTDTPYAAACSVAVSSLISPSPTIPSSLMRAYSPLLLFSDAVDKRVVDYIRKGSFRQLLVCGAPTDLQETVTLLANLWDPRRDLYFLVEPEESRRVRAALEEMTERLGRLAGAPLYSVAASLDDPTGESPGAQIVEVPRSLAPAAAQIILDVAAFRRFPWEDTPMDSPVNPYPFQVLGDPWRMRRAQTHLPNPATWQDVVEKYGELTRELELEVVEAQADLGGLNEHLRQFHTLFSHPIPRRPQFVVPGHNATILACIPYARHLGAILLPDTKEAREFVAASAPPELYVVEGCDADDFSQPARHLPSDPVKIALHFAEIARRDHEARVQLAIQQHSARAVSARLFSEMRPSAYVVVSSTSESEFWAAALAANYAAALGSPLVLFDDERLFPAAMRGRAGQLLSGGATAARSRGGVARHLLSGATAHPSAFTAGPVAGLLDSLKTMNPTYIGHVSNRLTIPLELVGDPPLATQFAVGRLSAPDLTSLSFLISAAALREEIRRAPEIRAVVAEAADAVDGSFLEGARAEASYLKETLQRSADVSVTDIHGDDDRTRFVSESGSAQIIHFAGHGVYDDQVPSDSALIFREGELRATDIPSLLSGFPIVFSNACQSGVTYRMEDVGRGWSGLAAAFIEAGAVNYIGSLWPVFDESSRHLAEEFYSRLNRGYSTGEALRLAKLALFASGDPTWASMVLFGCPRNRLRAGAAGTS